MSWQNILSKRQIAADIEEKWANQREVLCGGISRIYLSLANKWKPYHGTIKSWPHNLRTALEKYFRFQWTCKNNYGLKQGTLWQIVIFITQFSLKLYIQFWKYFHSMIIRRLGRGYCEKKLGARIFGKNFLARFS